MIQSYKFFITPTCPNCAEIKEELPKFGIKGEIIDASTDEGLEAAKEYSVMSVPTMVFIDRSGQEVNRATSLEEIKKIVDNKSLLDI